MAFMSNMFVGSSKSNKSGLKSKFLKLIFYRARPMGQAHLDRQTQQSPSVTIGRNSNYLFFNQNFKLKNKV